MKRIEHGASEETPVMSGNWGDTTWEFYLSKQLPDPELCTAVGFVAIRDIATKEVVLTLTEGGRGVNVPPRWESPSGHIDPLDPANPNGPREALVEAGTRETYEETGFVVVRAVPFGYRRITNPPTSQYPPLAFMPYCWAITDRPLETPTDPSEPAVGSFSIASVRKLAQLGMVPEEDLQIIELGLADAQQELQGPPHAL